MKNNKNINVLVTGANLNPSGLNTILSLRNKFGKIIGVDTNKFGVAKSICDSFYPVPYAVRSNYISTIANICKKEKIDVILPLTVEETIALKEKEDFLRKIGTKIANKNNIKLINLCNDKYRLNKFLKSKNISVPVSYLPKNIKDLKKYIFKLGFPEKNVVFKLRTGHGSRGFRIVSNKFDELGDILNKKPTDNIFITLDHLIEMIKKKKRFPSIFVMEFLKGDDYSIYSFSINGKPLVIIPMKRTKMLPGVSMGGELKNTPRVKSYIANIIKKLKLSGINNFQLKNTPNGPTLYEINTRISATTIFTMGIKINLPALEILLCLNRKEEIRKCLNHLKINKKIKMFRFYKEKFLIGNNFFELSI